MPQYYNPQEKARAMQKLIENLGDTRQTARETGISERTLQRWKHEYSPNTILMADNFEESMEVIARRHYVTIRNNLIDIVHLLESKIKENPHEAHLHILDYARLLRQLIAAEQLASARSFNLVILWEDPEGFLRLSLDDVPF